ncbi:MAG: glycosyltransferase [Candidatus Acidiferrales bacterium]
MSWLPKGECKSTFVPIGANIPERLARRLSSEAVDEPKTVVVFGVTGPPGTRFEIEDIAYIMRNVDTAVENVRLVVVGRGTAEVRESLTKALGPTKVQLEVRGVLSAEEIASQFQRARALLFTRGAISPQRGSAIAGIACGLPIVGYQNGDVSQPLKEAGIEWAPLGNREVMARNLIRVLTDNERWLELHERNLQTQKDWFSWDRIAEQFCSVLDMESTGRVTRSER